MKILTIGGDEYCESRQDRGLARLHPLFDNIYKRNRTNNKNS